MARETWTLYAPPAPAGYQLTDGWVRDLEVREGLYGTPDPRGEDASPGQGHGELWVPKRFGVGGFVTRLWMLSSLSRAQLEQWYDELLRVATWPYDLVRVVRGLSDGTQRECLAELVTSVEPTPIGQLGVRVGLEWSVPAGFWQDVADTDVSVAAAASGAALSFGALRGGTAPMDNLQLQLTGPFTGPVRLTQPQTKQWVEVTGNIGAGQTVTLNSATGAIGGTAGVTGDRVRYSGHTYLELPPLPDTVPLQLVVTHGGGITAASAVRLTGRRRWLA